MNPEAFHVVLTTHNSRTSNRMIRMGIQKGPAIKLQLHEEIELTKILGELIQLNGYKCIGFNICCDHVHLIIVCESQELSKIIQKLKSISSKLFNRLDIQKSFDQTLHNNHLWSQKYFRADLDVWRLASISNEPGYIYPSNQLGNTINYVLTNRRKHGLENSIELQSVIDSFVISTEQAFLDKL